MRGPFVIATLSLLLLLTPSGCQKVVDFDRTQIVDDAGTSDSDGSVAIDAGDRDVGAGVDAATDAGATPDGGTDGGPRDAGPLDVGVDSGPTDAGAAADAGPDAA